MESSGLNSEAQQKTTELRKVFYSYSRNKETPERKRKSKSGSKM